MLKKNILIQNNKTISTYIYNINIKYLNVIYILNKSFYN